MKFKIKAESYQEYIKNSFKDFHKEETFNGHRFSLDIQKDGCFYIDMIKPYSMNERWPWAKSCKPLTTKEYEMLDQSGILETDFDIYQVPKSFEFNNPRPEWVSYIENGDQYDVFRELIQLSEGLEYMADRT